MRKLSLSCWQFVLGEMGHENYPTPLNCPQSIPPTEADLEAVVREDSPEVLRETCPPELTSVDEKDVSHNFTTSVA